MLTNGMVAVLRVWASGKTAAHRTTAGARGTRCPASALGRRLPRRWRQAALAVACDPPGRVARVELPVPELAGDLLVALVEPFAVVRELAAAHEVAVAEADLPEPVGVGERLARRRDAVRLTALEDPLRLLEGRDAAARDDGRRMAGLTDRAADRRGERHVATERAPRVGEQRGHALPARLARVRIHGLTDLRLLGVLESAPLGDREIVRARRGKPRPEPDRVLDPASALDHLVA